MTARQVTSAHAMAPPGASAFEEEATILLAREGGDVVSRAPREATGSKAHVRAV